MADILTPKSSAIQAMRRSSLIPPTLVTSGCTISNAPRVIQGRKACRRVRTSPPAIGTGRAPQSHIVVDARRAGAAPRTSRHRNPPASRRCASPILALRPVGVAGAGIDEQLDVAPAASRAARTMASSSCSIARPNGPQPILKAREASRAILRDDRAAAPARPSAASHRAAHARGSGRPAGGRQAVRSPCPEYPTARCRCR